MINKSDLTDVFKTLHSTIQECTFFSSAHETQTKIDHMQDHNKSANKCHRIVIIYNMFSDHRGIQLGTNDKNI